MRIPGSLRLTRKKATWDGLRSRYRWSSVPLCWCQNWLCSAGSCFRQHPRTTIVRVRTSMLVTSSELSVSTTDAAFDSALRHASGSQDVRFPVVIGLVKLHSLPSELDTGVLWVSKEPTRVAVHPNRTVEIPERKPHVRWTTCYDLLRFRRDVDCKRVFLHTSSTCSCPRSGRPWEHVHI